MTSSKMALRVITWAAVALLSFTNHRCDALVARTTWEHESDPDVLQLMRESQSGPYEPKAVLSADDPHIECQTDSDCPMDAENLFRCMMVKGLKPTEKNNCRIAGVKPADGNQTCLCSTMRCTKGPEPAKDSSKLQYLMVGDCVTAYVRVRKEKKLFAQGVEMAGSFGNAGSTNRALHCLDTWAEIDQKRHWDVISFNFGLHDVAYTTEHLTVEEYRKQFTKIVEKLVGVQKRTGSKLLWISTTPIPNVPNNDEAECETPMSLLRCMSPPRHNKDVIEYNWVASKVVENAVANGAEISTLDMYKKVSDLCGGTGYSFCEDYQMKYNAHFTPRGNDKIAEFYEEAVMALAKEKLSAA